MTRKRAISGVASGAAGRLARLMVDVTPLRTSHGFRWLYLGQVAGQLARQVLVVTVPYQVFILTGSSLMVGLVGLAQVVPLVTCAVLGGTAADAFDRRRLLVCMQLLMAAIGAALALNSGAAAPLLPIFVLIALNAGVSGIEGPTRTAIIPSLVSRAQLSSAFALNQTLTQTMQIVGPAIAGVLIARTGLALAYWVAASSSLLTALALIPLGPRPPAGAKSKISLAATIEGWRYLRGRPLLQQVILVDLNAMLFGMPRALFPVIGTVILGGDATTVGLLYAAPGTGALAGALTTGWVATVRRQGRAIVIAVAMFGLAVVGFGLTRSLPVALALLAVAGAADVVSNVFRNTILQLALADSLRGRITAINEAVTTGGPYLGDAESGLVAELTTPVISVVAGGLATVAGAVLIAWRGRVLWHQTAAAPPPRPDQQPMV